jgi:D-alanine-D-alanine ligase-like ATP-grasp enzyme
VFHLLMEFQDVAVYQAHVTSYLELLRVPYAGCNPRGLLLARDKALSKLLFASTASRRLASSCSRATARSAFPGVSATR